MSNSELSILHQANTGKQQMLMDLDLGVPLTGLPILLGYSSGGDNESLVNSRAHTTHNPTESYINVT